MCVGVWVCVCVGGGGGLEGGGESSKAPTLGKKERKKEMLSLGVHFTADKNDDHLLTAVSGPATKASL